jgi:hypothetical protein
MGKMIAGTSNLTEMLAAGPVGQAKLPGGM